MRWPLRCKGIASANSSPDGRGKEYLGEAVWLNTDRYTNMKAVSLQEMHQGWKDNSWDQAI